MDLKIFQGEYFSYLTVSIKLNQMSITIPYYIIENLFSLIYNEVPNVKSVGAIYGLTCI